MWKFNTQDWGMPSSATAPEPQDAPDKKKRKAGAAGASAGGGDVAATPKDLIFQHSGHRRGVRCL